MRILSILLLGKKGISPGSTEVIFFLSNPSSATSIRSFSNRSGDNALELLYVFDLALTYCLRPVCESKLVDVRAKECNFFLTSIEVRCCA